MGRGSVQGRSRRGFLGLLGAGLAVHLAGCAAATASPDAGSQTRASGPAPPRERLADGPDTAVPPSRASSSGPPVVLRHGPAGNTKLALTIDDGYAAGVVAGYVAFAARTGLHLTFCPNASYAHAWNPHAPLLRPLIEAGQVQIMNHTVNHPDLTRLPADRVRAELEDNEAWVQRIFATSTRPYYRPPYGAHNVGVDHIAADAGFDRVVLWNGSYGDSSVVTPQYLIDQARRYFNPGVIMLGHANHPTVLTLFDQLAELLRDRQLQPVTLDEMFSTHRPPTGTG